LAPTKAEVLALLDAFAGTRAHAGAIVLSPSYLRAVERWESLPEQAEGTDKSWVLRADRLARSTAASARLLT
jgi:hypothetical protein